MNSIKIWLKTRDMKSLFLGLFLLLCSLLSVTGLLTNGAETFYMSGIVLFTIFGIAFIRKSKKI